MTGIERIAKEREEQIHKHGKSVTSDYFTHPNNELVAAAFALIAESEEDFPVAFEKKQVRKMLKKSDIERLAIAGALLAAEIDRIIQVCKELNLPIEDCEA